MTDAARGKHAAEPSSLRQPAVAATIIPSDIHEYLLFLPARLKDWGNFLVRVSLPHHMASRLPWLETPYDSPVQGLGAWLASRHGFR
ncbi:hypothetical protein GAS19_14360 [Burkholderia glumae]|uniref:hypothetical protein n=1 Tax=Burkholderia glumae TaxID=337 RepID=UPI0012967F35|nr:hypothetical protein [Burkholderia glumae]QGA38682.1 hypothetical protein GAS19_14360 [Burkholderia glumae]